MKLFLGKKYIYYRKQSIFLFRWQKSITGITKFEELPENAKRYIQRIEELTGIKVTWIGTGPAREQMILRE